MLKVRSGWRSKHYFVCTLWLAAVGSWGCEKDEPQYPPPTYVDYTGQQNPHPAPPAGQPGAPPPGYPPPAGNGAPSPPPGAQPPPPKGPTIGEALAPFGIVLPPNISLLELPPPSVWQNWPFTWPNLATPAPAPGTNTPQQAPTPTVPPAPTQTLPPANDPQMAGWSAREANVLFETNRRRAQGASCGGQRLPPAPPFQPSPELQRAARAHSEDMAQNNYFDHTSLDGRSVDQRARSAGYPGGFIGENIAAGRSEAAATVEQWMESPGHCLNIMEPRYRFLGVGYAQNSGTRLTHFWTQDFGG